MSHRTLVTLRNAMTQNYDKEVIHWKKELEDTLNTEVAEITIYIYLNIRTYMYVCIACK